MVEVSLMVLKSEDHNAAEELGTITLPGVPRINDSIVSHGAVFEVRAVTWHDTWVSLYVYSDQYGYNFPMPLRSTD